MPLGGLFLLWGQKCPISFREDLQGSVGLGSFLPSLCKVFGLRDIALFPSSSSFFFLGGGGGGGGRGGGSGF